MAWQGDLFTFGYTMCATCDQLIRQDDAVKDDITGEHYCCYACKRANTVKIREIGDMHLQILREVGL